MYQPLFGVLKWNKMELLMYNHILIKWRYFFESEFPNITFVYTTGNAQVVDQRIRKSALNNDLIRAYCIAHDKVLFDFGDIDSWYNGEHNYLRHIMERHIRFNTMRLIGRNVDM